MWERKHKNMYGETDKITRSKDSFTEKPVYDAIPGIKYTVEYLRSELDNVYEESQFNYCPIEPWELYDTYETDSPGLAIRELIFRMMDDKKTSDVKMFIDIGEKDTAVDIPWDVRRPLREMLQEGINRKLDAQSETILALENQIREYEEFINTYHATEMFRKFKEEKVS